MINYQEILISHVLGYNQRYIEASDRRSWHTVSNVLKKTEQHYVKWSFEDNVRNAMPDELLSDGVKRIIKI